MLDLVKTWVELKADKRAVTALEYALIAGVIVAVVVVGFGTLAGNISDKFSAIGSGV